MDVCIYVFACLILFSKLLTEDWLIDSLIELFIHFYVSKAS